MPSFFQNSHNYYWYDNTIDYAFNASHGISNKALNNLRIFFFIIQVLISFWTPTVFGGVGNMLKFMTYWGCLLVTLYFMMAIITSFYGPPHPTNLSIGAPGFLWKFTHILLEVCTSLQFLITIFFWVVILPIMHEVLLADWVAILFNVSLHGVTPLFIWIEARYNNIKICPRHAWFLVYVMIAYGMVNAYHAVNYGPVYPYMTWKNPVSYVMGVFGLGLALLGFWLTHKLHMRKSLNLAEIRQFDPYQELRSPKKQN